MADTSSPENEPAASPDTLLDCLLAIARIHGRTLSRASAMSGLPTAGGRLSPSLLARAAKRADLSVRFVSGRPDAIAAEMFPAIALMRDNRAVLVMGFDRQRRCVQLRDVSGDLGDHELSHDQFVQQATESLILVRADFRYDARAPEIGPRRHRHWFWGVIWDNWPLYRDALAAAALINLFGLAVPLFVMNVYDRVVPNQAEETLWVLAIGVSIVLLGELALRTVRSHFLDLAGNRVDVRLSAYIMERVLGIRLRERPVSAGSFAANLRSFEMVRDFITAATIAALIDLPFTLLFLLAMAWIAWPLAIPPLIGIVVVSLYAWTMQRPLRALTETTYRAGALRNATLVESLVGLETIKSIGAEGVMQRKWEESATYLARISTRLRLLSVSTLTGAQFAQQFVYISIVVLGVYLIIDQQLSMGGLIAAAFLSGRIMGPLGQAAGLMMQYHNARTALESLNQILSREVERPDHSSFVNRARLNGAITFKDVSFTYPGQEQPVLRNLNFRIAAGEKVGILGRVGSGKTTLHKLILGLYQPDEGAVHLDGIDLRQLDPTQIRRDIGYTSQEVTLFYGTLKENLRMRVPLASDAELIQAVELAGLAGFINTHPRGFDMLVGERGETLSGGQRQCLGLARAVLGDPPIVLLDEPSSAMDHSTEEAVHRHLSRFVKDKTAIIITHRTALLDLVDRLIVIDAGRIVADGPKDRVVAALRSGQIEKAE